MKLEDRQKEYEMAEAGRKLMPLLPLMIRLDGRGFSKFTKGLPRPFSEPFHQMMVETTKHLVAETNARIGYTQSDEITLVLHSDDYKSELPFGGRAQKLTSILAASASVNFNQLLPEFLPEKMGKSPLFDCRVWNVPTKIEAANSVLWRERDATKNSVSMTAFCHFSHKELFEKHQSDQLQMLEAKGIRWDILPNWFKRGTFIRRILTDGPMEADKAEKLRTLGLPVPEKVQRHKIIEVEMPPFGRVLNRVEVIFDAAEPQVGDEDVG